MSPALHRPRALRRSRSHLPGGCARSRAPHGGRDTCSGTCGSELGARFDEPADAVGALVCLRDVLLESIGDGVFIGVGAGSVVVPVVGAPEDSPKDSEAGSEDVAAAGQVGEPAGVRQAERPITTEAIRTVLDQLIAEAVDGATAALRAEARTDPLTGCANRLALEEQLGRAVRGAVRSSLDVAVAVIDLDGLKGINDSRGHAAGDAALLSLVVTLRGALRDADTMYRIGGDEFAVVAPFTDAPGAAAMLERARLEGGPSFGWGVASLAGVGHAAADDPHLLLLAADTDLYVRRRRARRAPARPPRGHKPLVASVAASLTLAAGAAAAVAAMGHRGTEATGSPNALRGTPPAAGGGSRESSRPKLAPPGFLPPAAPETTSTTMALLPPASIGAEALAHDGAARSTVAPQGLLAPPAPPAGGPAPQPPSSATPVDNGGGLLGLTPEPTTTTTSTGAFIGAPTCDSGDDGQVPTTVADVDPTETPDDDAVLSPRCEPMLAPGGAGSAFQSGNSPNMLGECSRTASGGTAFAARAFPVCPAVNPTSARS